MNSQRGIAILIPLLVGVGCVGVRPLPPRYMAPDAVSAPWAHRAPPELCVAMSGGGVRSASYNIGVLAGLHHLGALGDVELLSAVSGGSWAMAWYLNQLYWAPDVDWSDSEDVAVFHDRLFDPNGHHQTYLAKHAAIIDLTDVFINGLVAVAFSPLSFLLGDDASASTGNSAPNKTSYRSAINWFTMAAIDATSGDVRNEYSFFDIFRHGRIFDTPTFAQIAEFVRETRQLEFLFNATAFLPEEFENLREDLRLVSFGLGSDGVGGAAYGYWPWSTFSDEFYEELVLFDFGPAVSGAAVDADGMRLPLAESLVTRALDVNLGYWWPLDPALESDYAIYLTDGGHSENLGALSPIERRCRRIVIVDAGEDPTFEFSDVEKLRTYLSTSLRFRMDLDVDDGKFGARSAEPVVLGSIRDASGVVRSEIALIKLVKTEGFSYPSHVETYSAGHSEFPHERTLDQNFQADQYRAYRDLGYTNAIHSTDLQCFLAGDWAAASHCRCAPLGAPGARSASCLR